MSTYNTSHRRGLWHTLRTATVLCLAVLLVACNEPLYSGLSETEANQMRQALLRQGIDASKIKGDDGRFTVEVQRDDVGRSLRILEAVGLPRHKFASTVDVLKNDALVASPAEDRARLGYAISQELSSTISSIDGVVSARVHLVLPEKPALGIGKPAPASASVFVKHKPGYNLQGSALAIRQLVSRSVEGLLPEQVSVVLMAADAAASEIPDSERAVAAPQGASTATIARTLAAGLILGLVIGALAHRLLKAPQPKSVAAHVPAEPATPAVTRLQGGAATTIWGELSRMLQRKRRKGAGA